MPLEDAASWGEYLQRYQQEKVVRPRPDSEYAKPPRVTRYEKAREEVQYHPILQTFTDGPREKAAASKEMTERVSQLNRAKDKQVRYESPFDILTFADKTLPLQKPPPAAAHDMIAPFNPHAERPTFRHPLDSCYQYNIVSGLPLTKHHYNPPLLRPNVDETPVPTTLTGVNVTKPRLQHVAALPRDFDILSNRYVEKHDEKVKLEREIQRRSAAAKYWETHDYEPLLGHYLMPEKEEMFQEFMTTELAKQPMKSFNRLPPSLQKGEGFVYDITTHQVKNEDLYEKEQARQQATLERNARSWARDETMRNAGLNRQMLSDTRSINRQSHQRYVDTFRHGYNILDHRDYRDPNTYLPPPRTRPEPTVWQAVGPDRPPPPDPVPPPPPAIAPLLPTMPPNFIETVKAGGMTRAAQIAASMERLDAPAPAFASTAPASVTPGLKMLAEYESRAPAPA